MAPVAYNPPQSGFNPRSLAMLLMALREREQQQATGQQQTPAAGGTGLGSFVSSLRDARDMYNDLPELSSIIENPTAPFQSMYEALPSASSIFGGGAGTMFSGGATHAGTAIGTAANGGTMMSTGAVVPASEGVAMGSAPTAGLASSPVLPIAGAVGLGDLFMNKRRGARGIGQGAASGAAIGTSIAPGIGTAIGAGVGALAGGASHILNRPTTKEIEADRWSSLGLSDIGNARKGQDYFAGTGGEKNRDERFLTADAIRVNPDNYNNIPDWNRWNRGQQDVFLNEMLRQGKVREKKGGIYYDDDYAQNLAGQIRSGQFRQTPMAPTNVSPVLPQDPVAFPGMKPMERPIVPEGRQLPPPMAGRFPRKPDSGGRLPENVRSMPLINTGMPIVPNMWEREPETPMQQKIQEELNKRGGMQFYGSSQPKRSKTLSPGIGLDGKPLYY
jgi:hypothetical protein